MISPKFEISRATPAESSEIAKVHFSLISGSPLSTLGFDFLDKCYYRKMLEEEGFICLAAKFNGIIAGFISGVLNEKDILMRLLMRNLTCFPFKILPLFFTSSLGVGYLSNAVKRTLSQGKEFKHLKTRLMSMAILPEYRSRDFRNKHGIHIAKDLFSAWARCLRENDVKDFKFVTPKSRSGANRLYHMFRVPIMGETHTSEGEAWVYVGNSHTIEIEGDK